MSRKLIPTRLRGYNGPITVSTRVFQDAIENCEICNGEFLQRVCEQIPGHFEQFHPTTEDGYRWFCGHRFLIGVGEVAILIPWFQDWGKHDGSQADRSVATYIKGNVTESQITLTLQRFGDALRVARKEVEAVAGRLPQTGVLQGLHRQRPT